MAATVEIDEANGAGETLTHNIGDTDMVTVMWVNEAFNPEKPDTYFLEV